MTALLKYWREVLLAISICGCVVLWNVYSTLNTRNEYLGEQVASLTEERNELKNKISVYESAAKTQNDKYLEAEAKRINIINLMNSQISQLLKQTPPKDCQAAIDWAIQNKGDLTWQK
jgi:hypothetical protein